MSIWNRDSAQHIIRLSMPRPPNGEGDVTTQAALRAKMRVKAPALL